MLFCIFVLLACERPLTEPPPEASSSVARKCMRPEAKGMNVKAREAAPKGLTLTECSLPAPLRV